MNQTVKPVFDHPPVHHDDPHRTNTGLLPIGCLEIYCSKFLHFYFSIYLDKNTSLKLKIFKTQATA